MGGKIVCVICPSGCRLSVKTGGSAGEVEVTGARCRRGREFARSEFHTPVRTLTTTVRVAGGELPVASVRTSAPVPREILLECSRVIARVVAGAPVRAGQVLLANILGTGADVVATSPVRVGGAVCGGAVPVTARGDGTPRELSGGGGVFRR